jgi:hypothetical protein
LTDFLRIGTFLPMPFQGTVIKDACFDPDAEVRHVLTEKVFTTQARVMTAAEIEAV